MLRTIYSTLFLFLFLLSCGPDYHTVHSHKLENEYWLYDQSLEYPFPIQDTTTSYTFFLDIEHATAFPSANFYTRITTSYPSGEEKQDIISIELADEFGLWEGDCGRDYCTIRIPLQTNALFNEVGEYKIAFEQYTRVDSLPGLKEMTMRVVKN